MRVGGTEVCVERIVFVGVYRAVVPYDGGQVGVVAGVVLDFVGLLEVLRTVDDAEVAAVGLQRSQRNQIME